MYANFCQRLQDGLEKISVIGLGYVGLPLAVAFAERVPVLGFDLNRKKIQLYRAGVDPTREVGDKTIRDTTVDFTDDPSRLREARFHIIAVPTPLYPDHTPDLRALTSAAHLLGCHLSRGSLVVLESTVYPGVTEEICVPILEQASGLVCGVDFKVGYSPERVNPGDRKYRLDTIVKVIAGMDEETLDVMAEVYGMVAKAGIYPLPSIRHAEFTKLLENTQRDVNIALMNHLAVAATELGLDMQTVLDAAKTKWNFADFSPGLVGGHCIGVDSWYLDQSFCRLGHPSNLIREVRRINDGMGKQIVEWVAQDLIRAGKAVQGARVAVLGFTFKENCPDIRNTRVYDVIQELRSQQAAVFVTDPLADPEQVRTTYGEVLCSLQELREMDAVVLAVAHHAYCDLSFSEIDALFGDGRRVLMDIKGILHKADYESAGYLYRRL